MSGGGLFDLSGMTAVVTGASRGIGLGIARGFLAAGADVVAMQRGEITPELEAAAADTGRRVWWQPVELTDESSVARSIANVLEDHRIDILVNNAGTQLRHESVDFPLADFDTVMNVNARAVFQLCRDFAPPMLERGRGKIINLASLLSFQGGLRVPAYAASKGAVVQLTKAFTNEWAVRGVNVNAIAPGYFATDMNSALLADAERYSQISARVPAGRWGVPDDIAGAAVFLASSASDYVHGAVIPVDGGWLAR
jgi:2-deoxy-D-gluconate 3-dehydrogenase